MTTTPDPPNVDQSRTLNAAEWGLASLLLGGLLAVMAMLTLQINLQMYLTPRVWSLLLIFAPFSMPVLPPQSSWLA